MGNREKYFEMTKRNDLWQCEFNNYIAYEQNEVWYAEKGEIFTFLFKRDNIVVIEDIAGLQFEVPYQQFLQCYSWKLR